ncbi:MAG: GNAT family N-acetyltransferase [Treponema sp.]|nr:GNAT family N-acetyltransferase [Treponema sp.]
MIDFASLFNNIYPDFFKQEYLKTFPEDKVCEELVLSLAEFDENIYSKYFPENVTFGFYDGPIDVLRKTVALVDEGWVQYYNGERAFCGFVDNQIACFCILEDMGTHEIDGKKIKVAGPGCVGTLPEFRNRGLGLTMVKKGTAILKAEGYDLSLIHYTGVGPWYKKLGYKTVLRWNKNGFLEDK